VKQLILFFALITGLPVFAQHFKTDTFIVRNRVLNKFVKKCKALDTLDFNMQAYNGLYMTPRPDVHFPLKSIRNKEYSLPYKGDQYRFEKAFGIFPENELLKTIDQYKKKHTDCFDASFSGYITKKKCILYRTSWCQTDDDEKYFIKVENGSGFSGGTIAFEKFITEKISPLQLLTRNNEESVYFLIAVILKDSTLGDIITKDSAQVEMANAIKPVLMNTKGWVPYNASGRPVKSYLDIFIRFRKNGTIEADFYH